VNNYYYLLREWFLRGPNYLQRGTNMSFDKERSDFLKHIMCEKCGSSDAGSLYADGGTYCYSCKAYNCCPSQYTVPERGGESPDAGEVFKPHGLYEGEYKSLGARKIPESICRKYGYMVGHKKNGEAVQIANYYDKDSKKLTGQKIRQQGKKFAVAGTVDNVGLFGQQCFGAGCARKVIITEGEIDALSIASVFEAKWPVVSVISGAQSAYKNIKANLEWVLSFDEVVLWFDDDDAGHAAVDEVSDLFRKAGQLKVIQGTGYKDANALLVEEGTAKVLQATYNAQSMIIDGIRNGDELWDLVSVDEVFETYTYPFPKIEEKFQGLRKGELVTFTAGSGVGKSTIVKEITYHLVMTEGLKVGHIALEENLKRSALGFMGMYLNKPMSYDFSKIALEERKTAFDAVLGTGNFYFYDHFGSLESENLIRKMRLLVLQNEVDFLILDHVSIVVSGNAEGDERKAIDALMTNLRSLSEETQAGIIVVSHLRRPQGDKGHEDGATVSLAQLRGSGAIAQLSDGVVGVERDMQDAEYGNHVKLRVLKNRFVGDVGLSDTLEYDKNTGRMSTYDHEEFEPSFGSETEEF
jgi:twinkle protein